ncbi:GNAT family N-acetyltransferase [Aliikangiella maris]|uniref:GNAT family N-acetyltransferase n=2 Tax=Aliikangiella maris TaxID=3162458 RepID=A0ABV2BXP4_9GAMM
MLKKIFNKLGEYINSDAFLILRAPVKQKIAVDESDRVEQLTDIEEIKRIYQQSDRSHPGYMQNFEARIQHGLTFFVYYRENEIAATTWMLYDIPRFIDELVLHVYPEEKSLWIRDIYVTEKFRGKNCFAKLIYLVSHHFYRDSVNYLYSDVQKSNFSSVRAHEKYGFMVVDSMNYTHIFQWLIIRSIRSVKTRVNAFAPTKSVLLRGNQLKSYIKENIA